MGSGTTLPHLTSGKNVDEAAPCLEAAATASAVAAASRHGWLDLSKYQNRWGKPRNPNVILGILCRSSRLSESTHYLNHCMCCVYIPCVLCTVLMRTSPCIHYVSIPGRLSGGPPARASPGIARYGGRGEGFDWLALAVGWRGQGSASDPPGHGRARIRPERLTGLPG